MTLFALTLMIDDIGKQKWMQGQLSDVVIYTMRRVGRTVSIVPS